MNPLREALDAGRTPYGAWCTSADPGVAETVASSGIDWVLLDAQHGAATAASLPSLVRAVEVGGAWPVVRVAADEPHLLMRALDHGAVAVVVPQVNDADQARRVADACRYPPEGTRSFGPPRPAGHPSRSDRSPLCLPMVESAAGLAAADDIAATAGVDGIVVGAVDLALSMGLRPDGDRTPSEVLDALDQVVAACRRHGVVAGAVARDAADALDLQRRGVRLLTVASDRGLLAAGLRQLVDTLAPTVHDRPQEVTR